MQIPGNAAARGRDATRADGQVGLTRSYAAGDPRLMGGWIRRKRNDDCACPVGQMGQCAATTERIARQKLAQMPANELDRRREAALRDGNYGTAMIYPRERDRRWRCIAPSMGGSAPE